MVVLHKFGLSFQLVHVVDCFARQWPVGKKFRRALIAEDCVSVVVLGVFDEGDLP